MITRPLRNRVTPFGEIIATPHRGGLMGNRGCLHDDDGRITRSSERAAWISCKMSWPNIRRQLMRPGYYTELFFLDEATALAAGHRPCGSCQPDRLEAFKLSWARAYGLTCLPKVALMDEELRRTPPVAERIEIAATDFPEGAFAAAPGSKDAWLHWQGAWHQWSFAGYDKGVSCPAPLLTPLTPAPIMVVLSEGYVPDVALVRRSYDPVG